MDIISSKLSSKNVADICGGRDIWKCLALPLEDAEFSEAEEEKSLANQNSGIFNIKTPKPEISEEFWGLSTPN